MSTFFRSIVFLLCFLFSASVLSSCQGRLILTETARGVTRLDKKINGAGRVWFVKMNNGEPRLIPVKRKVEDSSLYSAVKSLLAGPSDDESKLGYGSEIPRGTILLGVNKDHGAIEVNVSRRFCSGGGISSIETRLDQISRTISDAEPAKDVYLSVEGKRLSVIGGEGIEVKQPINK